MVLSWLAGAGATTAAAGAGAGKTLFDYNRENFLYDRKMRQETEYTIMEFRMKQAELWRDDVRDIIGLTSVKMDTYLIVNAVQLGFCVMAFCEGRLAAGTPTWLIGCHTLSLAGAFTYLLMSVWLAMHATVAAKSYETRLLTQLVRLPVPSWAQLEGARTYGSAFEKVEPRQMFRIPFAMGTQESVLKNSRMTSTQQSSAGSSASPALYDQPVLEDDGQGNIAGTADAPAAADASTDPWGLERRGDKIFELDGTIRGDPRDLRHIQLVREAMQYWQSYDGFARVSMSVGTNQLVFALSYYVLGYVLISNHAVIAAWLAVVLFVAIACGLIRLDMSLTKGEWLLSCMCCIVGPFCMAIATRQWAKIGDSALTKVLSPIAYFSHLCWMLLLLHISKIDEQKGGVMLPIGFRSVMYLDVFGWIKTSPSGNGLMNALARLGGPRAAPAETVTGAGPGVQAVKYAQGQPVPQRVEDLPGAAKTPKLQSIPKKEFDPTTFAPREKLEIGEVEGEDDDWKTSNAGARPWKVFCGATALLAMLWGICGILVTFQMLGYEALNVSPLLREAEDEVVEPMNAHSEESLLQGGRRIVTHWPHANVRPLGLSCDGDADKMVASTRFGLFTADIGHISNFTKHGHKPTVSFIAAPLCEAIEGESIQDVSVHCHPSESGKPCEAMVLHQQGRRISTCDLSKSASKSSQKDMAVTNVADAWLSPDSHSVAEGIMSLASAPQCAIKNNKDCAFIGTSSQRIVEMDRGDENSPAGNPEWFPNRIVRAEKPSSSPSMSSGALHFINKRYLGLLLTGNNRLEALDLEKQGAVAGSWVLPPNDDWNAMCATGDDLYLLSKGPSPELWHFPVPEELKPASVASLAQTKPAGARKRTQLEHATLAADADVEVHRRFSMRGHARHM
mmetsp:Transcript_142855/g.247569  ORF Transcript_142855/g.247569 Transcript_142855/m.247569 type:complete len:903 (-) Transcript_142855:147-2855(-)